MSRPTETPEPACGCRVGGEGYLQPIPLRSAPISLATRHGDPFLDLIARSVYALFPRCLTCGQRIARYEDAEVRILQYRVVHRGPCPAAVDAGES